MYVYCVYKSNLILFARKPILPSITKYHAFSLQKACNSWNFKCVRPCRYTQKTKLYFRATYQPSPFWTINKNVVRQNLEGSRLILKISTSDSRRTQVLFSTNGLWESIQYVEYKMNFCENMWTEGLIYGSLLGNKLVCIYSRSENTGCRNGLLHCT